jgi:uncharacterized protein YodC (DUF2158 family)
MTMEKTVSRTFNQHEDFEIGDRVRLKSSSPSMTIDRVAGSRYECVWFGGGDFHREEFDQASLEKVPTKDPDLSPA